MQFSAIVSILFAGLVAANPIMEHPVNELITREVSVLEARQFTGACPAGLYSSPLCCSVNVLGALSLNCDYAAGAPSTNAQHKSVCKDIGKVANCCFIPVAGQGVLCLDTHK